MQYPLNWNILMRWLPTKAFFPWWVYHPLIAFLYRSVYTSIALCCDYWYFLPQFNAIHHISSLYQFNFKFVWPRTVKSCRNHFTIKMQQGNAMLVWTDLNSMKGCLMLCNFIFAEIILAWDCTKCSWRMYLSQLQENHVWMLKSNNKKYCIFCKLLTTNIHMEF